MAAGDAVYGTPQDLADISRLNSLPDGEARVFGKIAAGVNQQHVIFLDLPINSLATGAAARYEIRLVESIEDVAARWTDSIDPSLTGNVAPKLYDAISVATPKVTYDATHRNVMRVSFHTGRFWGVPGPAFFAIVVKNNSGQAMPASGAAGKSQTKNIAGA